VAALLSGSKAGWRRRWQCAMRLSEFAEAKVFCACSGFGDSIISATVCQLCCWHQSADMECQQQRPCRSAASEVRDAAVRGRRCLRGTAFLLCSSSAETTRYWLLAARRALRPRDSASSATSPTLFPTAALPDTVSFGVGGGFDCDGDFFVRSEVLSCLWRCRTDAAGLATRRAD